jgi:hypothetical protein
MEPCSPSNTVSPDADALAALMQMQRTGNSRLLVIDQGRLTGILSLRDMLQFLSLKLEFGDMAQSRRNSDWQAVTRDVRRL